MDNSTEILSLWIGPESQQAAHHFYSLQAEQFFDEEQDPTEHRALWTLHGNPIDEKNPKMMVFDTKSDHLTRIRKINHAKMIKKLTQVPKGEYSFNFFAQPQEQEQEMTVDQQAHLFQNWTGKEQNYVLIDQKFSEDSRSFEHWESLYKLGQEVYEDRIRKRLQKLDYLHLLNFCTDGTRLGFASRLLNHFQDICPKKSILFTNLSQSKQKEYVEEVCMPLLSEISQEVSILIDFDISKPEFDYFEGNFYHHLSPVYNCILTPFMLKNADVNSYFNQICSGKRSLFDIAYTLPIISEENELQKSTNIFNYVVDPSMKKLEQPEVENRVNYGNKSFLNAARHHQKTQNPIKTEMKLEKVFFSSKKILSQAYVLKGHFNEVRELCHQRSLLFDIKYLHGIFVENPEYKLKYTEFYRKAYGQDVEAFPMHTVLYQNAAFGPAIRNYLRQSRSKAFQKNELLNQWKEGAISLSDMYGEEIADESD